MAIQVTFNATALRTITVAAANDDLRIRGNRVLNAARRLVPRDTSRLGNSLTLTMMVGPQGEPVASIGSNLEYAIYVHEGTGLYGPNPHMIVPKNAKVLRWPTINNSGSGNRRFKGGQTAAFTYSMHSRGMKGRPFLVDALEAAR